jgi:hypothetical protein
MASAPTIEGEAAVITLTVGALSVALPGDLLWADESSYSPVVQTVAPSITGAALVMAEALQYRPITLRPASDTASPITLGACRQLRAWADTPLQEMTLTLRGMTWDVIWRHNDNPALDWRLAFHVDEPDDSDLCFLGDLRFLTI